MAARLRGEVRLGAHSPSVHLCLSVCLCVFLTVSLMWVWWACVQIKRYLADADRLREPDAAKVLEHVVSAYVNSHRGTAFHAGLVHVCAPLVACVRREPDVYACFVSVMARLGTLAAAAVAAAAAR
jgi:hypothetical protein